jgi:hypothetical protein
MDLGAGALHNHRRGMDLDASRAASAWLAAFFPQGERSLEHGTEVLCISREIVADISARIGVTANASCVSL